MHIYHRVGVGGPRSDRGDQASIPPEVPGREPPMSPDMLNSQVQIHYLKKNRSRTLENYFLLQCFFLKGVVSLIIDG